MLERRRRLRLGIGPALCRPTHSVPREGHRLLVQEIMSLTLSAPGNSPLLIYLPQLPPQGEEMP